MDKREFLKGIEIAGQKYSVYDLNIFEERGLAPIRRFPFCLRVLLENLLRKLDGEIVKEEDLLQVAGWKKRYETPVEIPFYPARVLMQDFTGVPAVVDLAAMRDAMRKMGGDPKRINPLVPVDLVIDHSVQADFHGTFECQELNVAKKYERNSERYALLKWAQRVSITSALFLPVPGFATRLTWSISAEPSWSMKRAKTGWPFRKPALVRILIQP